MQCEMRMIDGRTPGARSACIASLHFSPAFVSHMVAYSKVLADLGFEVDFVVHPEYTRFTEFSQNNAVTVSTSPDWETSKQYEIALFTNAAPTNHVYAELLRKRGCKVWYVYHEPWESLRTYLRTENLQMVAKLVCAHYLSVRMLKASDGVILPSQHCLVSYERSDVRHNSTYSSLPLLFDDESGGLLNETRRYFSYIGNVTKAHGFEEFVRFAKFALKNDPKITFQIASRRPLPLDVTSDKTISDASDRFVFKCGRPLSNQEINLCFAQSICVWNLYRRSTQSGVLAKAMMFGTPVIASGLSAFYEFIQDRREGRVLLDADPLSILLAYEDIRGNLCQYVADARRRFLRTFYYKAHLKTCQTIFASTTAAEGKIWT